MSISLLNIQLQTIERDIENESLFRTTSVATNVVTSLEPNQIRCVTTLCNFARIWNVPIATHFILLGSIAESSSTSGYVVFPERFGQKEEPAGSNKERGRKKPSLVPKVGLIDAIVFPSM